MLKKILLSLLVLVFGLAAFHGFTNANAVHHFGSHLCPMTEGAGVGCPPLDNSLEFVAVTFTDTKDILKSLIGTGVAPMFFLVLSLLFFGLVIFQAVSSVELKYKINKKLHKWLAILNKRNISSFILV